MEPGCADGGTAVCCGQHCSVVCRGRRVRGFVVMQCKPGGCSQDLETLSVFGQQVLKLAQQHNALSVPCCSLSPCPTLLSPSSAPKLFVLGNTHPLDLSIVAHDLRTCVTSNFGHFRALQSNGMDKDNSPVGTFPKPKPMSTNHYLSTTTFATSDFVRQRLLQVCFVLLVLLFVFSLSSLSNLLAATSVFTSTFLSRRTKN